MKTLAPRWLTALLPLVLLGNQGASANADLANGEKVFERKCADCHALNPSSRQKRGPLLAGVVGSKAGSVPNYHYSEALAAAKIVWTPERLAEFISAPRSTLPGTKMRLLFSPNAQETADLIAWLQSVK